MINYEGRLFRPVTTDGAAQGNSDTTADSIFRYSQKGDILTGTYSGGAVRYGQLIGTVDAAGHIDMRYHHVTMDGALMTGICHSRPEILDSGKIRLHERWRWTSGDASEGRSTLEEL